jgi:spore maturation protein CgeB
LFKPSEIRRFDITVSGSSEGIRGQIYQLLLDAGFNVHRSGGMMQNDHFLSHAEYAQEMAESRIVVNTQTWDYRIQLKGRTAQALACGCFLLEQRTIESERFLADIGVVLWSDIADLVEKARYWLAHDEEREKLAQDCRRRYLERHSCESWTRTVLQRCGLLS